MEEAENIVRRKGLIKRVSLFRKRKRPQERSQVSAHKHRNYKKFLINVSLIVIVLFILATLLYIVRNIFLQNFLIERQEIIKPQGSVRIDNNQIQNIIQNKGLDIEKIVFSTSSATVSFYFEGKTQVFLSRDKDIDSQLDLIEAIDRQLESDGKQAIYIDLRYNKPIVRMQ